MGWRLPLGVLFVGLFVAGHFLSTNGGLISEINREFEESAAMNDVECSCGLLPILPLLLVTAGLFGVVALLLSFVRSNPNTNDPDKPL